MRWLVGQHPSVYIIAVCQGRNEDDPPLIDNCGTLAWSSVQDRHAVIQTDCNGTTATLIVIGAMLSQDRVATLTWRDQAHCHIDSKPQVLQCRSISLMSVLMTWP